MPVLKFVAMSSLVLPIMRRLYLVVCALALFMGLGCRVVGQGRGARASSHGRAAAATADRQDGLALSNVHSPKLEISSVLHHGGIVEIEGSADPGDTVMINGEPTATFFDGNGFKHFIGPLPTGLSIVTITVQNDLGGVTTRQLAITTE
jgi:hypothetical protein